MRGTPSGGADLRATLENCAIGGLTQAELAELTGIASEIVVPKGETIFQEDATSDTLFVVLDGAIHIRKRTPSGGSQLLVTLRAPSILGEISFLTHARRSATAVTAEETRLLAIPSDGFRDLLDRGSLGAYKLVYGLARVLGQRFKRLDEKLVELLGRDESPAAERLEDLNRLKAKLFDEWVF